MGSRLRPGVNLPSRVVLCLCPWEVSLQNLSVHCVHGPMTIDCIDYVTGIGNAHGHNGVHSVLRLGSQLLVVPLTFL